eukprot:TRINITY_DN449_c15_g1_i1.p1 TRINITY_DN449_c15_g1~~TRINITY_DN449_c15_g1_i1.p1  ORF type:complete len:326 (+),score=63.45 TRINITY_DN449_c15_g1_i1:51-1028(+)
MSNIGTVTKWFPSGFGFIQGADGTEVYVKEASIVNGYALTIGDTVNFDIDTTQSQKPGAKIAATNVSGPGVIAGMSGVVQSYNPMKKFGFITASDGQSYFVHSKSIQGTSLIVGEPVNFSVEDVGHESGKPQATNVQGKGVVLRGKLKCVVKNWLGKYGFVVDKLGNEIFIHSKEIQGGSLTVGGDVFCDSYTKEDGHIAGTNVSGSGVTVGAAPAVQQSMMQQQTGFRNVMPALQQMAAPMQLTSATGEEMRMDTDGQFYTRTQFIEQYGGIREFNNAPRMIAAGGAKGRGRGGFNAMGNRAAGGRIAGMSGSFALGNKFNPYT